MIPAALLYLGQMQLALLLLLAVYYAALRRLTFHALNRAYLLGSLALAALYPALDLSALSLRPAPTAPPLLLAVLPSEPPAALGAAAATGPTVAAETWWWLAYGAGAALLLVLLLVQAAALWRLHRDSWPVELGRNRVRAVAAPISPFSFGRQIYLNPARHAAEELPAILLHERVHVRQWHSLDTVLAHLHRALAWASPAAWLWLRAVQENLEFIADAAVLRESGLPAKAYQYNLLRLSSLGAAPAFATPFTFITLKNRIQMMNTPESSPRQLGRYAAGLGLLLLLAAACATPKSVELPQPTATAEAKAAASLEKLTYVLDGRSSTKAEVFAIEEDLLTLHVYKSNRGAAGADLEAMRRDYGSRLDDGVMFAFTKSGAGSPAVRELQAKYKIQLPDPAVQAKKNEEVKAMYGKLLDGKGLTDAEIGGRLILIDERPATAAQLRALPGSTIGSFATSDGPDKVHGEAGRKGVLRIITKQAEAAKAEPTLTGGLDKVLTEPLYYVDGQPTSKAAVEKLQPTDVSSMWVMKNDKARQLYGFADIGQHDVIMVVTKANEQSAEVQHFIRQHNIESGTSPESGQSREPRSDVKKPQPGRQAGPRQPTGALYPNFLKAAPANDRC